MWRRAAILPLLLSWIATTQASEQGAVLYRDGLGSETDMVIVAGEITMPMKNYPCAGCHGEDGRGKREGGVVIPAIYWRAMQRRHPMEDRDALMRRLASAIREGRTPDGRQLSTMMPRYPLRDEELEDLLHFLEGIEKAAAPGVDETSVRIGLRLPDSDSRAPLAETLKTVLRRYFASVNETGGIWGRRIELTTPENAAEPFCVLLPMADLPNGAQDDTPLLFPLYDGASRRDTAIPLLASRERQAALLLAWWLKNGSDERALIVVDREEIAMAQQLVRVAKASGRQIDILMVPQTGSEVAEPGIDSEVAVVFWLTRKGGLAPFSERAGKTRPIKLFSTIANIASRFDKLRNSRIDTLIVSNPLGLPEADTPAYRRYHAFRADLPPEARVHDSVIRIAYTAASLLEEALRRSGRRLTRQRLLQSLNGITNFESGAMPPLTLGQRLDRPAQLLRWDPADARFAVLEAEP